MTTAGREWDKLAPSALGLAGWLWTGLLFAVDVPGAPEEAELLSSSLFVFLVWF
jgi:hypothetical protein